MFKYSKVVGFIIAEVLFCVIIGVPLLVLQFTMPHQSGFFPNDTSISYPMRKNTVSMAVAAVYSILVPVLLVCAVEVFHAYNAQFPRDKNNGIPLIVINLYKIIGMGVLSFIALLLVVQIGKETIGSLRPFFLEACQPLINDPNQYQAVIECTGSDARLIDEARMSFPSGHSACAAWGAVFAFIYLQLRFPKCPAVMFKSVIQTAVASASFYICLTRIQDNWHRPADVIVGSILGTLAASLIFWSPIFKTLADTDVSDEASGSRHNVEDEPLSLSPLSG